jgi:ABC-2 type transport system ATP-binding protein
VACPRFLEAQEALEGQDFVHEASLFGTRLHMVVGDAEGGRRRTLELLQAAGNVPASVERIVPSLEDVFIHCIEAEGARRSVAAVVA